MIFHGGFQAVTLGPSDAGCWLARLNATVPFRHIYEAETSTSLHPWRDLHASASYSDHWPDFIPVQVDGRVPVDIEGMTHRVEDLIAGIMERL